MPFTLKAFTTGLTGLNLSAQIAGQIASSVTTEQYESTLAEFKASLTGVDAADIEGIALNWLKAKQSSPIETENVPGVEAVPQSIVVKVVAFKLQPAYRADKDKPALSASEMNLNRSHFELQGVTTDGKLNIFIVGYKQMYHNLGMSPATEHQGIVPRTEAMKDAVTTPVKSKVIGKFVILQYQSFVAGTTYRVRDDSNPGKKRSYTANDTANHVTSLALDEVGEFEKDHEVLRANRLQRDTNSVTSESKVKTASELLNQLVAAQNNGLAFDAVEMLKALVG